MPITLLCLLLAALVLIACWAVVAVVGWFGFFLALLAVWASGMCAAAWEYRNETSLPKVKRWALIVLWPVVVIANIVSKR